MSSILVYSVDLRLELREKLINVVLSFYPKCRGGGAPACGARLILSVRWPLTLLSLPPPLLLFIRYIIRLLFYYTTL
jgi:hypothetical protein